MFHPCAIFCTLVADGLPDVLHWGGASSSAIWHKNEGGGVFVEGGEIALADDLASNIFLHVHATDVDGARYSVFCSRGNGLSGGV